MNFRVNLAVALAAALSFACADKQATIPELEEAMKAPPGMKVVGLYRMDVTPVETASGIQYALQPIPVGQDGNPNTNPVNTVQVVGSFGLVTTTGPGGCAGVSALTAAVEIKNFTIDPLRNVWADVIDMTGGPANTACNSTSSLGSQFFAVSDMSQGIWKYNDLAAAPNATGQTAGGISLPIGGVWGFRYVTTTPFRFFFRIVADDQSPAVTLVDPAGPLAPLTWSSAVAANTLLEICPANPGLIKGAACPAALTLSQQIAGVGVGPWTYSFAPTTLTQGQQYWWRARNVYPIGTSIFTSGWMTFTYNGVQPTVPPIVLPANAGADPAFQAMLAWTTPLAVQDTWVVLCSPACPATRPVPPAVNAAILVDQAALQDGFPGPTFNNYTLFVGAPPLLQDAVTGTYLDPAATYDWRVYNYDIALGAPAFAAPHTAGSLTVTPVALAPVIATPGTLALPAVYSLAGVAPFTVTFTTATPTVTAGFDLLDLDPLGTGLPFYTTPVLLNGVLNGVSGLYDYSVNLRPLVTGAGVGNYLMTVYNGDLLGVFGAPHYFNVTP